MCLEKALIFFLIFSPQSFAEETGTLFQRLFSAMPFYRFHISAHVGNGTILWHSGEAPATP